MGYYSYMSDYNNIPLENEDFGVIQFKKRMKQMVKSNVKCLMFLSKSLFSSICQYMLCVM